MGAHQGEGFATVNGCHAPRLSFPKLALEEEEALAALLNRTEGLRWEGPLAQGFKGSLMSLRGREAEVGSAASLPPGKASQRLQPS